MGHQANQSKGSRGDSSRTRAVDEEGVDVFVSQAVGLQQRPEFFGRGCQVDSVDEAEDLWRVS